MRELILNLSHTFVVAGLFAAVSEFADSSDEGVCWWPLLRPAVLLVGKVGRDPLQHSRKGELVGDVGRGALVCV